MRRDTIIGMINDYDHADLVNLNDLIEIINDEYNVYSIDKYCDLRCSTNLTRFAYDPYDGMKIDWKEVKNELKIIQKEKIN